MIGLNTLILALDRYPIDEVENNTYEKLNLAFIVVFFLEILIKLIGQGFKAYFRDLFQLFDLILVLLSVVDIIIQLALSQGNDSRSLLSTLRALRLLRIFRLAVNLKELNSILQSIWNTLMLKTIWNTLKDITAFSVLLFLFLFIYSLLGLELFAYKVKNQETGLSPKHNFDTILNSFLTVFITLTGDDWNLKMLDFYVWYSPALSIIFFTTILVIGQYFLMNLFIAVLLQNFEEASIEQEREQNINKIQVIEPESLSPKNSQKTSQIGSIISKVKIFCKGRKEKRLSEGAHLKAFNFLRMLTKKRAPRLKVQRDLNFMDGKSLWYFSIESNIRRRIYRIVQNQLFELFYVLVVAMTCLLLAYETPFIDPNSSFEKALQMISYISSALFTMEFILKVIAYGFINCGQASYLNSWANVFDLFVLLTQFLDDFNIANQTRLIKVLRPVRVISRIQGLQLAVHSIIMAIPNIINVTIVSSLFTFIFGMVSVSIMKGQFYHCNIKHIKEFNFKTQEITKWNCMNKGGIWENRALNFDNVLSSINSLMHVATMSQWADIMLDGMTSMGIDQEFSKEFQRPIIAFFFVLYVLIGGYFNLNLFVGVVISSFNREREKITKDYLLTRKQKEWIDSRTLILRFKPQRILFNHQYKINAFCLKVATHHTFEKVIFAFIITNTFSLMIKWHNMPDWVSNGVETFNYISAAVFTCECIIKIVAFGREYFKNKWNAFDFTVVIMTLGSIIISQTTESDFGPQTLLLRSFRILRALRLVRRAKSLRILFNTLLLTLPAAANIAGLIGVFLFIYAILGMNLFAQIKRLPPMSDAMNFDSTWSTVLVLLKIATVDNWGEVIEALTQPFTQSNQCLANPTYEDYLNNGSQPLACGRTWSVYLYFYSFLIFWKFIQLNILIAIILEGFQETLQSEQRTFNSEYLERFGEKWQYYDPEGTGFIVTEKIPELLNDLGAPFGNNLLRKNTKGSVISQNSSKDQQELFMQKVLVDELSLAPHNDFKDYYCLQILQAISFYLMIEDLITEQQEAKAEKSNNKYRRTNSFSVYEPERVYLKEQLMKEIRIIQENNNNIQPVKYIQEREIEIMPHRRNRYHHMRIIDPKFEVAARFLIKHLRAFVRKLREESGIVLQTLSPRQIYEIDTLIIEDIKLMQLNRNSLSGCGKFQPNYDTLHQEDKISEESKQIESEIIIKHEPSVARDNSLKVVPKDPPLLNSRGLSISSLLSGSDLQRSSQGQPRLDFHARLERQQHRIDAANRLLDPTNDTSKILADLSPSAVQSFNIDQQRLGEMFYQAARDVSQSIEMIQEDDQYSETEEN